MLRELRRQVEDLFEADPAAGTPQAPGFELLLVYDEDEFEGGGLSVLLEECLGPPDPVLNWRLLPTTDGGYYRNKDRGARAAEADIIVFLDSDVIPEPGWLERLLLALNDPAVDIVVGSAYIDPSGLVGKTFALTWFFPLRSGDGPLKPVHGFFANNLAQRRAFYLDHPFPDLVGTARGACVVLARQFGQSGIPIYQDPRARVSHAAPNGLAHISKRALAQGRDRLYRERNFGSRWSSSWLASLWRWLRNGASAYYRVFRDFRKVGLNPLLIPAALAISGYYYTLYWLGEMASHLRLPAIRRIRV
jgi:glycosyltransferase involved in cell wall biosynthesis